MIPEIISKVYPIDRTALQPILNEGLNNGRIISTEGIDKILWLGIRVVLGLGGSDVAPALGISPYKSSYILWKEKVGDEVEIIENKYTIWGNLLEDPIAQEYMRITGRTVVEDNKIRIHDKHDCLFVNLDRVIIEDGKEVGLLECKSTVSHVIKSWDRNEEECAQGIPLIYYCQIQHELSVSGLPFADLAIGVLDSRETVVKRIERDDEYITLQEKALVGWWNGFVVNNVPPPLTASEYQFVDPVGGSTIEADKETESLFLALLDRETDLKKVKKEVDTMKDTLRTYIGENELLTLAGKVIATYKMISKKGYEVPPNTYRQLNIKRKEEKI